MGWCLNTLVTLAVLSAPAAAQKKRVAVLDFGYATVRSYAASVFGTDEDVGRGIADLIVGKLVQDGTYSVILQVRGKARDVRDPASGKTLRSIEDKIGVVVITEADDRSAMGTFTGVSAAKVGGVVGN